MNKRSPGVKNEKVILISGVTETKWFGKKECVMYKEGPVAQCNGSICWDVD